MMASAKQQYPEDISMQQLSPRTCESPASPSSPMVVTQAANFSVINYVGKSQKHSFHRSSMRCRVVPYEKLTTRSGRLETTIDDNTNSSTASSAEYSSGTGLDSNCGSVEPVAEPADMDYGTAGNVIRSRRSMSVSSSGCSSSLDDRNSDFSPIGSIISCRCNSFSISDFDDDGFREDSSVSSACSVFSGSRPYNPHHQLHHNHQNVPHHPNNHKGLFDIALKTVKLIRRNQELQLRLTQLQQETHAFIESVMANPENASLRSHYHRGGKQRTPAPTAMAVRK